MKAKRRSLGLIKFIGELFKLQMLTERIMYKCVKNLLGNVDNPEEEEIESLCKLLTIAEGSGAYGCLFLSDEGVDKKSSRYAPYAVHASSLSILLSSVFLSDKILQDVIELRERKWISRQTHGLSAPSTIAQVHEAVSCQLICSYRPYLTTL